MSARKSLLFVVIGVLFGALTVAGPAASIVREPEETLNYRLMESGPPVKS